jgi:chloramphenicol O-acetyltransferase type B
MSGSDPGRSLGRVAQHIRATVRRGRWLRLSLLTSADLQAGQNVWFGAGAVLAAPSFIRLGDNVAIGRDFHLETNLEVGSDVLISSRVAIVGNDHLFNDAETSVFWQGRAPEQTVHLEGDNLIGFGTIIIGAVTVGRGCIVCAGSIVTRDLPPQTVCVGAPAKPIRDRHHREERRG